MAKIQNNTNTLPDNSRSRNENYITKDCKVKMLGEMFAAEQCENEDNVKWF